MASVMQGCLQVSDLLGHMDYNAVQGLREQSEDRAAADRAGLAPLG